MSIPESGKWTAVGSNFVETDSLAGLEQAEISSS